MHPGCQDLRSNFTFDFEYYQPDIGVGSLIQDRGGWEPGSVLFFGDAIKECGLSSLIPWCIFYMVAGPCGVHFLRQAFSIAGEGFAKVTNTEEICLAYLRNVIVKCNARVIC